MRTHTPDTYTAARARAHIARSRAFHDGLHALASWITGGKPQR